VRTRVAGVLLAAGEGSRFGQPKALVELNGQTLAERGVNLLRSGGADPILVVVGAAPVELDGTHTVYNPQWRTGMGSSLRAALQALVGSAATTAEPSTAEATTAEPGTAEAYSGSDAGVGTGTGSDAGVGTGTGTDAGVGTGTGFGSDAGVGAGSDAGVASGTGFGRDVGAVVVALADQPLVGAEAVARLIAAYRDGATVAVAAYDGQARNPVLLARECWAEVIAMAAGDQGARTFLRARPDLVTVIECGDTGRPDDIDTPADLARITAAATERT
jgi:CTP:molybdopterin cytidylyltransferase MocA